MFWLQVVELEGAMERKGGWRQLEQVLRGGGRKMVQRGEGDAQGAKQERGMKVPRRGRGASRVCSV